MYFVEEFTHLVQQEGLELFKYLEETLWTPWLLQQPGIVNKEMWIQTDDSNPCIVKNIITWYSSDSLTNINQAEVEQVKQTVEETMASAGFIFQYINSATWYSQTIIDQGVLDNDNDQDDNDDITGDPSGLNPDGSVIPDDDSDIQVINNMDMKDMNMEDMKDMLKEMGMSDDDMANMSEDEMCSMVEKMKEILKK